MDGWTYAFDPEKNAWLIRERGISFEQIIARIEDGHIVEVRDHHNQTRYPGQRIYEIDVDGYIYLLPAV